MERTFKEYADRVSMIAVQLRATSFLLRKENPLAIEFDELREKLFNLLLERIEDADIRERQRLVMETAFDAAFCTCPELIHEVMLPFALPFISDGSGPASISSPPPKKKTWIVKWPTSRRRT